ncbi:MAG: RpiB/LacA/LacB family sugar-phosphate isomerase, partial [Coprococcus sp.]
MRIAVINEVSASLKNADIIHALESTTDAEILNVGMKNPEQQPQLTYIHTSYMAAILLNTGACDFVVGGCGTGQGFLNAVLQFPNVFCGLITEPLDAWLFSQINGGNCISLPLNKGYGWAGDINLKYVFEKLFADPSGQGYPLERAESQ